MTPHREPNEAPEPNEVPETHADEAAHTPSATASDGYPRDSEGYQPAKGNAEPAADAGDEADAGFDEGESPGPGKNIARRLIELTKGQEWDEFGLPKQPRRNRSEVDPVGGWMPDEALGETATSTEARQPPRRHWQVNMRLDHARYTALERAASVYGTRPTALARMLVNRGVEAILNAHRAEMALLDPVDPAG